LFRLDGKEIVLLKGDITKVKEFDAIVNPANSLMIMGGGVAGAIARAGGDEIEKEARAHAPVPVGKAVITGAGRLSVRYVIHAPTMERPAMRIGEENVRKATRAALEAAEKASIKSLLFPGMGTGVGGVSPEDAARVMVEEIISFLKTSNNVVKVGLIALHDELYRAFLQELKKKFG
jgi:O-acetyl-ADP-ribose deacetylase (regulator of RNase III)